MPGVVDEDLLTRARDAMAKQAWDEAYGLLSEADQASALDLETLGMLSDAAYLSARPDEAIGVLERIHTARLQSGDKEAAAGVAGQIAGLLVESSQLSMARGWIRRARTLLEDMPDSPAHGYVTTVAGFMALITGDVEGTLTEARRAIEIGTRVGDPAVRAIGLNEEGRALLLLGQVEEGMALIDEAAVAAVSGELDPISASILYCSTVCAFQSVAEYDRAEEWTQAMDRHTRQSSVGSFRGWCRVHRAEIMRLRGAWQDAEGQARKACDEVRPYGKVDLGWPYTELGLIRLRMGNLTGSEEAFLEANELGWDPQPGLALVRLANGDVESAAAQIRHALDNPWQVSSWEFPPNTDLRRAPLLAAQVEIAAAAGDVDRARWAADELETVAARFGSKALRATAAMAKGTSALADGDLARARRGYEESARLWKEVGAPYESARARMGVAAAARAEGEDEGALLEVRAARSTFERLGARLDVRRAMEEEVRLEGPLARAAPRETKVFMFTDIVKSTDLIGAIGDEAWGHLVRWHNEMIASLAATYGGDVVQTTGDGFFVAFDDAKSGIECAVMIQRALDGHRREHGFAPRVRIGLHQAEATREGTNWSGIGVHAAARIGALADGEEILVSRETADEAGFDVSERRSVSLKGIAQPVDVVAVAWRAA
jgi:class 3 adenylate cyclase